MGQFSMVIYTPPGSLLSGNQQDVEWAHIRALDENQHKGACA